MGKTQTRKTQSPTPDPKGLLGPGVRAWNFPAPPDLKYIDVPRYKELVLRAVYEVLQPLGVNEKMLRDWLFSRASYLAQPGILPSSKQPNGANLPLPANLDYLRIDY